MKRMWENNSENSEFNDNSSQSNDSDISENCEKKKITALMMKR